MVPPASHRVSRVPWYSGSYLKSSRLNYVAFTLYSGAFQLSSSTIASSLWYVRNPNKVNFTGLACSAFARRYLRNRISFSSSGYLDVSVPRVPFIHLWIQCMMTGVLPAGFPHSDIRGSMDICSSPRLFAAYHVFRRLSVPRHPPCALSCLTSFSYLSSVADMNFCFFYLLRKLLNFF